MSWWWSGSLSGSPWIAVAILVLFVGLFWLAFYLARRVDARYEKRAALASRADHQHQIVMASDDRGAYGMYPPADLTVNGPANRL